VPHARLPTRRQLAVARRLGVPLQRTVTCYRTVEAACKAPRKLGVVLPRNTTRQILTLEVGTLGDGTNGITKGPNGALVCRTVRPVFVTPLPEGAHAARAAAQPRFWLPAGGVEVADDVAATVSETEDSIAAAGDDE
jgi:hypothetical protein